jgi:hypothetical protein
MRKQTVAQNSWLSFGLVGIWLTNPVGRAEFERIGLGSYMQFEL